MDIQDPRGPSAPHDQAVDADLPGELRLPVPLLLCNGGQRGSGRLLRANPAALALFEAPTEEALKQAMPGTLAEALQDALVKDSAGWTVELRTRRLDGEDLVLALSGSRLRQEPEGSSLHLVAVVDITEQQRRLDWTQAIIRWLPEIFQTGLSLEQLCVRVHDLVRELMPAENFYLALLDEDTGTLSFPYWVDETESAPRPRRNQRGATEYVIRTGEPVLLDPVRAQELVDHGEMEPLGTVAQDWLGVPLKAAGRTIGALVVQNYRQARQYHARERDILVFVSGQIAQAIDRIRLDQARSHLVAIVASSEDAIYSCDLNGTILSWNRGAERHYGYPAEEVVGRNVDLLLPPDHSGEARELLARLLEGEPISRQEAVHQRKDGRPMVVSLTLSPLLDARGRIVATSAIVSDITERQRHRKIQAAMHHIAEAALTATGLEAFFNHVHATVNELMPAENFYVALYDEATGMVSFPYMVDQEGDHPPPRKAGRGLTEYVIRTGRGLRVDRERLLDLATRGEVALLGPVAREWMGVPLRAEGRIMGVLALQGYQEDPRYSDSDLHILSFVSSQVAMVLERKRAEAHLVEREALLARAQAIGMLGVFEVDLTSGLILWSPENYALWGLRPEEGPLSLAQLEDRILSEDRPIFRTAVRQMDESCEPVTTEFRITWPDGSLHHLSTRALSFPDAAGRVVRITGINQDVTTQRNLEQQIREREASYRLLADNALDVIWVWKPEEGFEYISPSVIALLGTTAEEISRQKDTKALFTEDSDHRVRAFIARAPEGEDISQTPVELEMRHKHGRSIWTEARIRVLRDPEGRAVAFQGASRDITERRRIEQELLQREQLLRQMFELHASVMLLVEAGTLRILDANRAARAYYGIAPDHMSSLRLTDISTLPEPLVRQEIREASEGRREVLFAQHIVASGDIQDVEVRISRIDSPLGPRLFAIVHDITERIRAEAALKDGEAKYRHLAEENARLLERSRQEAEIKSLLLEEVNHRVKNNLSAIMGMLEMESQAALEVGSGAARSFQELQERIYALATVHELLSAVEWAPLPLEELCRILVHGSLGNLPIQDRAEIEILPAAEPVLVTPRVATSLGVILAELAMNSAKYALNRRGGGRIRITLRLLADARHRVQLTYTDDGPGFPLDVLEGNRENIGLRLIRLNTKNLPCGEITMCNTPGATTILAFQPLPAPPRPEAAP